MNRLIKVCAVCVVIVWIFCMGLAVGTFKVRNKYKKELEPTSESAVSVQQSQQNAQTSQIVIDMVTNQTTLPEKKDDPLGEKTTGSGNISTFASSEGGSEPTPSAQLPSSYADIAKALVNAVNATKATQNFTAEKKEKLTINIDSVTGGLKSLADSIISKSTDRPDTVCTFSNGVDSAGSGKTPNSLIAPINKMASLSADAIKDAKVTPGTNGAYTIEVELKSETQTLNQSAKNHAGIFETLDISSFGLPSNVSLTEASIDYSGARVTANINKNGKLDSIAYVLPITQGSASGKMSVVPVSISMHGQYDCSVTCTYG
ncbi:MAG: hypothetical protein ACI4GA_04000 [Acutalibacteraceae bacterium]|nr:hypothetical protein [Oscillospiraceae bacterium]